MVSKEDLTFETNEYAWSFEKFETMRSFAENIGPGKIISNNVDKDQSDLLIEIVELKKNKIKIF